MLPLQLAELAGDNVLLDADLQPIGDIVDLLIRPRDVLAGKEFLELSHHRVVDLEVLVDRAVGQVVRCEVEEDRLVDQLILEVVALGRFNPLIQSGIGSTRTFKWAAGARRLCFGQDDQFIDEI